MRVAVRDAQQHAAHADERQARALAQRGVELPERSRSDRRAASPRCETCSARATVSAAASAPRPGHVADDDHPSPGDFEHVVEVAADLVLVAGGPVQAREAEPRDVGKVGRQQALLERRRRSRSARRTAAHSRPRSRRAARAPRRAPDRPPRTSGRIPPSPATAHRSAAARRSRAERREAEPSPGAARSGSPRRRSLRTHGRARRCRRRRERRQPARARHASPRIATAHQSASLGTVSCATCWSVCS